MVQVPGVGGREPRLIARRLLGEIIEPRMEEIFAMAQRELIAFGRRRQSCLGSRAGRRHFVA